MAGKKYRPALFELVGKGRLKPNKKGTLTAPKWFYGRTGTVEPLRKDPKVVAGREPQFPVRAAPEDELSKLKEQEIATESNFGLRLVDKKLAAWAPYWVIGLLILGLILCFVVAYRLGQSSMSGAGLTAERQTGQRASIENGFKDLEQRNALSAAGQEKDDSGTAQQASLAKAQETRELSQPDDTARQSSNSLILCGSKNERDLRPVQEYFSTKRVLTKIGRFEGRFILYCEEGTDRPSSREAENLKQGMMELGKSYNSEKPRTAPSFPPETFESVYWVLREKIQKIES